jgi:argininosuccinate lyase
MPSERSRVASRFWLQRSRPCGCGVPFREAHEAIGRLVARARSLDVPLDRLPPDVRGEIHPELADDTSGVLSLERSLEARRGVGTPARASVEYALAEAREATDRTTTELEALSS